LKEEASNEVVFKIKILSFYFMNSILFFAAVTAFCGCNGVYRSRNGVLGFGCDFLSHH
jgi:hypothetical protein